MISYQLAPGTFYNEPAFYIYELHDGHFVKHWGPYWTLQAAQAQIQAWEVV